MTAIKKIYMTGMRSLVFFQARWLGVSLFTAFIGALIASFSVGNKGAVDDDMCF
jgi:hypothetical protein